MAAVRRLFGWMAGLAGIAALARVLSARRARVATPRPPAPPAEDPADALRRKLSESREEAASPATAATDEPTQERAQADEPTDAQPPAEAPTETIDERRARIHAKAQEAIDAMQEPPA